jgi:3-oxoacyl-[acyl-carrier-protein] synthase III
MKVGISAIEYYLPKKVISNDFFKHAKNEFLEEKVGIKERRVAEENEYASDMGARVINDIISKNNIDKKSIDFLVVCSLSPDYPMPQMASIFQKMCGLKENLYSFDIRMGCSGFVYSLSLAEALIRGFGYKRGLVVTVEKFQMYLSYEDFSVDTLFSDSATATLVEEEPKLFEILHHDFGTDGNGVENIIVEAGGSKLPINEETSKMKEIKPGINRAKKYLYMNGRQVMKFASKTVPPSAKKVMDKEKITIDDLDWVVMHQANKTMLEDIARRMDLPAEKNYINLWNKGNTISSSIPIALQEILDNGQRLNKDGYWMITGFGLGYAWGTTLLKYNA